MADLKFIACTTPVALAAGVAQTVLIVTAPANQKIKVLGFSVSFDGKDTTILSTPVDTTTKEPVLVELISGVTAGTFSSQLSVLGSYGSKKEINGVTGTSQSTAQTTVTVEPTATSLIDTVTVPITNNFNKQYNKESFPVISGAEFIGIRCTSVNIVNVIATLVCEE